jgi:hypothetical protein
VVQQGGDGEDEQGDQTDGRMDEQEGGHAVCLPT